MGRVVLSWCCLKLILIWNVERTISQESERCGHSYSNLFCIREKFNIVDKKHIETVSCSKFQRQLPSNRTH